MSTQVEDRPPVPEGWVEDHVELIKSYVFTQETVTVFQVRAWLHQQEGVEPHSDWVHRALIQLDRHGCTVEVVNARRPGNQRRGRALYRIRPVEEDPKVAWAQRDVELRGRLSIAAARFALNAEEDTWDEMAALMGELQRMRRAT